MDAKQREIERLQCEIQKAKNEHAATMYRINNRNVEVDSDPEFAKVEHYEMG